MLTKPRLNNIAHIVPNIQRFLRIGTNTDKNANTPAHTNIEVMSVPKTSVASKDKINKILLFILFFLR